MTYYRCRCGEIEAWSSIGVRECEGCELCLTTLETHSGNHRERAPHTPVARFDQNTGERIGDRCQLCHLILQTQTAEVPAPRRHSFIDLWEL